MKKLFSLLLLSAAVFAGCVSKDGPGGAMIATPAPERVAGQTDMLQFAAPPLPVVRVAFIGLGMRGPGAVERMTWIPGVEIVALCDVVPENTARVNDMLEERGRPRAREFNGDTEVWRQVTALPDVDLVYVATDWIHHAQIGIQAMNDGKHVAIEVPSAMNMEEIWELVDTSERTRKHCLPLENCCYDFFELTTLNMVQQGLLGEIIHGEGAYIHGLQPYWDEYWNDWRMAYNRTHRGDLYPTHGLGPVCQAMGIHRGDKMNFLVSVDTRAVGNPEFLRERRGEVVAEGEFRNGDHTSTLIRTERGHTILVEHNVTSPRPYDRMYQLTGTRGFANKYPVQGFALDSHSFVSDDERAALMERYKHPIVRDIEELARTVGGHGGMDFVMDYRLIWCLQRGLPLDMDVYDLAEWCCVIPLSEISLDNGSAPVEIPDFTRGGWNRLSGFRHAVAE